MSELISNEIGENEISEKIGDKNSLELKIKESYKEIYETKGELQKFKNEIAANLSGEKLKNLIAAELTTEHVISVLEQAQSKFSSAKEGIEGFNAVYADMGAGLVFNMQLGLAKLGCKFDKGIDGIYGSVDTKKRVQEFQTAWNSAHPDQLITVDGWAGKQTIEKIILAMKDASWDKSKVARIETPVTTEKKPETNNEKTDNKKTETAPDKQLQFNLSYEEFIKNIPNTWKEKKQYYVQYSYKDPAATFDTFVFYGNGRVDLNPGQDKASDMHNWEKKNNKLYIDGKEWKPRDLSVKTEQPKTTVQVPFVPKTGMDYINEINGGVKAPVNKETQTVTSVEIPKNGNRSKMIVDMTSLKNGRYEYRYEGSKLPRYIKESQLPQMIADANLEDKSFSVNEIFTEADRKGPNATKIAKLKSYFNADNTISMDDVKVVEENGKKYVQLDFDNGGMDSSWNVGKKFPYDELFAANGTFQKTTFLKKVREDMIANVLPHIY